MNEIELEVEQEKLEDSDQSIPLLLGLGLEERVNVIGQSNQIGRIRK